MATDGIFIIICFVIIAMYWSATMFMTKRSVEYKGGWLLRIACCAVLVLFYLLSKSALPFVNNVLWHHSTALDVAADVIALVGLITMLSARITLGRDWSANIVLKEGHNLVERGPYAYVRHPIYSGLLLLILGAVIYNGTILAFILFVLFFFGAWYKAQKEENLLLSHFPEAYSKYKTKVRAFIPFLF